MFCRRCNVVTVNVTHAGGVFTLDGFDDQCGAATHAAIVGTAFPNPNGSIGLERERAEHAKELQELREQLRALLRNQR